MLLRQDTRRQRVRRVARHNRNGGLRDDRAVIELRHFQDLSYLEIAAALGRPLSDVKSDLFRARRLLAQALVQPEPHAD